MLEALTAENRMMPAGELWRSQERVSCPFSPECVEEKFSEVDIPSIKPAHELCEAWLSQR
jgi:hypothetical protein